MRGLGEGVRVPGGEAAGTTGPSGWVMGGLGEGVRVHRQWGMHVVLCCTLLGLLYTALYLRRHRVRTLPAA